MVLQVRITAVDPDGIAVRSGVISEGLFIQAINDMSTVDMCHADIVKELAKPDLDLVLSVHPFAKRAGIIAPAKGSVPVEATSNIVPQKYSGERTVILTKAPTGLLGLRLGIGPCGAATIAGIDRKSPAAQSTMQIGDVVIGVNGMCVVHSPVCEIATLIAESSCILTMTVVTPVIKQHMLDRLCPPSLVKGGHMTAEEIHFSEELSQTIPHPLPVVSIVALPPHNDSKKGKGGEGEEEEEEEQWGHVYVCDGTFDGDGDGDGDGEGAGAGDCFKEEGRLSDAHCCHQGDLVHAPMHGNKIESCRPSTTSHHSGVSFASVSDRFYTPTGQGTTREADSHNLTLQV